MKNNILITMAILILVGLAVQGMLGVAAGILVSAIIGIHCCPEKISQNSYY
jgi:hypothetical protein